MTDPFTSMEFAGPGRWLGMTRLGRGLSTWPTDARPSGPSTPSSAAGLQRSARPSGSIPAPVSEQGATPSEPPLGGEPAPPRTGPPAPREGSTGTRRAA